MEEAGDDLKAILDPMVCLLQQDLLLLDLSLQRALGLFELAALVQSAQVFQFGKQPGAHVAPRRLRVLKQQPREFLVRAEQLTDIVFVGEVRVEHGPVMGCPDEGEQAHQMFEALAAERMAERLPRAIGSRRLDEDERGGAEQLVFERGFRRGPLRAGRTGFEMTEDRVDVPAPREEAVLSSLMACSIVWGTAAGSPAGWP